MPGVEVQGPDQQIYQFPDGTTKDATVAYFKKKGIGVKAAAPEPADELESLIAKSSVANPKPTYGSETLSALRRGITSLAGLPGALLTPHDTAGATREEEVKMGPVGRALFNIPADLTQSLENAEEARKKAQSEGANWAGQALSYAENIPIVGNVVKKAEEAGPGYAKFAPETLGAVVEGLTLSEAPRVATEAGLGAIGKLREKARPAAQFLTRSGPGTTTQPIVEKYLAKSGEAAEKQGAANATHRQAAGSAIAKNLESDKANSIRETTQRSIEEGSAELGNRVKELDSKLRVEANEKYDTVRKATANDPGVPINDLANEARKAEGMLKGSSENIKQFRELIRKAPETEGIETSIGFTKPGDALYEALAAQGKIVSGDINFSDLQGYSSEIGLKLSKGNLPGDVYQALKYLKDKIDTAKSTVAERNGVGPALKDADSFWHSYMKTFYDKDSPVAKVRESVGSKNKANYADAFTTGKASDVGVENLNTIPTRHASDAKAVADLARNLRAAKGELRGTKTAKTVDIPPRKIVPQPAAPTAEEIVHAKTKPVESKSSELGGLRRFDLMALGSSLIHGLALPALALLSGEKTIAAALDKPAIKEWIAKPTPRDIEIIQRLPEPARSKLTADLQKFIDDEKPSSIHPAVRKLLNVTGKVSKAAVAGSGIVSSATGLVQNRKDALDRLHAIQQ